MDKTKKEKITYDHQAFYKATCKGNTDRILRAHRSRENRKSCRLEGFTKNRRVVMSPLQEQNSSVKDLANTTAGNKLKKDKRKEQLMMWRQQQVIKNKELSSRRQKKTFVVRHVKTERPKFLGCETKKSAPIQEAEPIRRSTRIAKKQGGQAPKKPSVFDPKKRKGVKIISTAQPQSKITKQNENSAIQTSRKKHEQTVDLFEPALVSSLVPTITFARGSPKPQICPLTEEFRMCSSFAPTDFQFSAPTGLGSFSDFGENFTLKPLSPKSAESFFVISSNWLSDETKTSEDHQEEGKVVPVPKSDAEVVQVVSDSSTKDQVEPAFVQKFKLIIAEEEHAINTLCDTWQSVLKDLGEEMPEDIKEKCDVTIGMAGVLLGRKGKFHQFKGLVAEAQDGAKEKTPTEDDLEGFWSMVAIQVDKIKQDFEDLDKLKNNGWKPPSPKPKKKKAVKAKVAPIKADGKEQNKKPPSKPRPSFRQFREQMKKAKTSEAVLTPVKVEDENAQGAASSPVKTEPGFVQKFKLIIAEEEHAINTLCDAWQSVLKDLGEEMPEDIKEKCDVTIGMAGVLLGRKGKFNQFKGLVAEAQDGTKEKTPTEDDLEGFWSMVAIQVEQIKSTFAELEKMKSNGWKSPEKPKPKAKKRIVKAKVPAVPKKDEGKEQNKKPPSRPRPSFKKFRKELLKAKTSEAFCTVLTPVRNQKTGDFVLTPVRRSLRGTPVATPVTTVSTPAYSTPGCSTESALTAVEPELRLTPTSTDTVLNKPMELLNSASFDELYLKSSSSAGVSTTCSPVPVGDGASLNFGDDSPELTDASCTGPEIPDGVISPLVQTTPTTHVHVSPTPRAVVQPLLAVTLLSADSLVCFKGNSTSTEPVLQNEVKQEGSDLMLFSP